MTTTSTAQFQLRGPADILAAVPYLLGFHPADSIVMLGLRRHRLVVHSRGDLFPAGLPAADLTAGAQRLTELIAAQGVTQVILVGYGDPPLVTRTVLAVRDAMRGRGMLILEALRAEAGRFWSYQCAGLCCPSEGTPYDVAGSVVAAEATVAGWVALPDREAVVRALGPPTALALVAIQHAGERAGARLDTLLAEGRGAGLAAEGRAAVRSALDRYGTGSSGTAGSDRLSDDEVAWLSLLIAVSLQVRDWAWRSVDTQPDQRAVHERLWTDVVRRCEPSLVPGPAVLLAYTCWRRGDGIRASIAVERALDADPRYSAAQLISEVLAQAIPPTAVATLVSGGRQARRQRRRAARRRTR